MEKPTSKQMLHFWRLVDQDIVNRENFQAFLQRPNQLLESALGDTYPVTIDYSMSLAEMIRAGNYDWVNSDINEKNFPVKGSGKVTEDLVLFHLGKDASTQQILDELDRRGFKPASTECSLAFGATYPEKQKEFPIIALGSVWLDRHGGACSPCLDYWCGRRELDLRWRGGGWDERCRFLAVRK